MTPERRKYYCDISKEEQAIRALLLHLRHNLRQRKYMATVYGLKKENDAQFIGYLHSIKAIKFQIKVLKSKLPAPLKHYLDDSICICGMHYGYAEVGGMFYCKRCGQAIMRSTWYRAKRR